MSQPILSSLCPPPRAGMPSCSTQEAFNASSGTLTTDWLALLSPGVQGWCWPGTDKTFLSLTTGDEGALWNLYNRDVGGIFIPPLVSPLGAIP